MENYLDEVKIEDIKNIIYTIRGKQVMLDCDVAKLYDYETKSINKAVKRNIDRFPEEFCFKLTEKELKNLRFQFGTSNNENINNHGGRRYLPYVFTEQGIAMLSGVLKSDTAVKVSINIIKAFVEMRKFMLSNGQVFDRLTKIEYKLLENDRKFDEIFNQLQNNKKIKQKIFFKGQIYDAYSLIVDIVKSANKTIIIIDNYIDDSIFELLSKKKIGVDVFILTSNKNNVCDLDILKFNKEYPNITVSETNKFHDRFIIVDNEELYHCGASIKDLGKKCFAISRIENKEFINIINKNL